MSKKKVLNAILLALSVLLTTIQGLDEKEDFNIPKFTEKTE